MCILLQLTLRKKTLKLILLTLALGKRLVTAVIKLTCCELKYFCSSRFELILALVTQNYYQTAIWGNQLDCLNIT